MNVTKLRSAVGALALAALLGPAVGSSAVPPPLGPVATVLQANTPTLGTETLRLLVQARAQQIVDATNADLAAQGSSISASVDAVMAWSPYRTFTQDVDRPNQYFVRQPLLIKIDVDIPGWSNRTVTLSLDIEAVCDGWHRSAGLVRFFSARGRPTVTGGNIFEEILTVRDLIDAKVSAGFPGMAYAEEPQLNALADLKGRKCATIGVQDDPGTAADMIIWSHPLNFPNPMLEQDIEVTPLTLRRLEAYYSDTHEPIGDRIEYVRLETSANFHAVATAEMAMQVNESVALNQPTTTMVLYGEPTTSLVVIGNVRDTLGHTNTGFAVSTQSANYSPGTHTLQLETDYWIQLPQLHKPLKISVATYELTYDVKYVPPLVPPLQTPVKEDLYETYEEGRLMPYWSPWCVCPCPLADAPR